MVSIMLSLKPEEIIEIQDREQTVFSFTSVPKEEKFKAYIYVPALYKDRAKTISSNPLFLTDKGLSTYIDKYRKNLGLVNGKVVMEFIGTKQGSDTIVSDVTVYDTPLNLNDFIRLSKDKSSEAPMKAPTTFIYVRKCMKRDIQNSIVDDFTSFGRTGWTCPKCGKVLSPDTPFCYFCNSDGIQPVKQQIVKEINAYIALLKKCAGTDTSYDKGYHSALDEIKAFLEL